MMDAIEARIQEIIEESKAVKYPYGGTDSAAYVARQVVQNESPDGGLDVKIFSADEVRYFAARECAIAEAEKAKEGIGDSVRVV